MSALNLNGEEVAGLTWEEARARVHAAMRPFVEPAYAALTRLEGLIAALNAENAQLRAGINPVNEQALADSHQAGIRETIDEVTRMHVRVVEAEREAERQRTRADIAERRAQEAEVRAEQAEARKAAGRFAV